MNPKARLGLQEEDMDTVPWTQAGEGREESAQEQVTHCHRAWPTSLPSRALAAVSLNNEHH